MSTITDENHITYNYPEGYQPGCMIASIIAIALTVLAFLGMSVSDFIVGIATGDLTESGGSATVGLEYGIARFITVLGMAGLFWLIVRYRNPFSHIGLGLSKSSARDFIFGGVLTFITIGLVFLVIIIFRGFYLVDYPPDNSEYAFVGPFSWTIITLMILFYATAEEILFRGFLYPWLKKSAGFGIALVLTSILFSMMHIGNPAFFSSPLPFVNIILASTFLTLLRDLTLNLWAASGAHFIWNFVLVSVGIPVSGMYMEIRPRNWWFTDNGPALLTGGEFGPEGGLAATLVLSIMCVILLTMLRNRPVDSGP